ncbi:hypothetical protein F441_10311 [Phytophthora nicotianae CJ01A1]|uniref:Uncharacterized protein n=1 Tax=Phytophthora nicotianae CJ01A1 TaxID=1317063 RepID=W2WYS8_PHYNI|nr:hypothetical protein F441_10311 [Phytophthora nicotianae CJ01A1]
MNAPDEKTFKMLWHELKKTDWDSRRPKGLAEAHVRNPGVKGRLDNWKRGEEYFFGVTPPGLVPLLSPATPVSGLALPEPVADPEVPAPASEPAPPVSCSEPVSLVDDMEPESPLPVNTNTEECPAEGEEESKNDGDTRNDFGPSDSFMAALRSKRLFGDVVDDDVNICEDVVRDEGEDDGVNEEAMDVLAVLMEFESDVDSDVEFEDKSDAFQQDDDAMRRLEWRVYDQAHSDELQLDKAAELYSGSFGVTRSAGAYVESPTGMFFVLLSSEATVGAHRQ